MGDQARLDEEKIDGITYLRQVYTRERRRCGVIPRTPDKQVFYFPKAQRMTVKRLWNYDLEGQVYYDEPNMRVATGTPPYPRMEYKYHVKPPLTVLDGAPFPIS